MTAPLRFWTFIPETNELDHDSSGYRVDLDRARTPAERQDWVRHLSEKPWMDTASLWELRRELERRASPKRQRRPRRRARKAAKS